MDFLRRNINKTQRNGDIYISSNITSYSSYGGSGSGGSSSIGGNYLPATANSDGTYTVDLTQVNFKGNIIADGEVSAYGSGATVDTEINLENYYTKDQIDNMFDTMGGGNVDVDLSDYYTKDQTDTKLSSYVTTTALNNHTGSTAHITSTERTNWNAAYNNNHTHSNKSVIDGISSTNVSNWNTAFNNNHSHTNKTQLDTITSTKITNWDKVVSDWDKIFSINSDGSLKVKVNLYGDGEVSAFGSGATSTDINLENYYTKTQIDNMFDTMGGGGTVDLSDYYTKDQTDTKLSGKSDNGHTHSISNITNLQSTLDGKSGTGHSHSNYATTSHTHSQYASSSHTHSISNITNLQSTLDGKSGTGHSHSNYSVTSHTHSQYASSSHTHSISNITNLQSTLDGKSGTGHSHSNYSVTSHTHNYAGSSSAGGAATSANKLNTNGGSATQPVYFSNGVPVTCTTYANASVNYANSAGSATNATNATNATTASKLSTVSKTAWGQTFWTSGGIPTSISGNMTGVGSISANGNITTSAEVTAHSDIRLKTNIKPLTVRGTLNPVQYVKDGKESIGFIANEVQELYPELVIVDESSDEKYLSLNYQQLTAVLYAEIQELKNEITELKNKHKWL